MLIKLKNYYKESIMGDVIVRLVVNKKNGTYKAEVVGHENGAICGDGIDEDIIEDLLNAEVPGYGKMTDPQDGGKTCEYFEEKMAKQRPHAYHDNEDDDDDGEEEETTDHKKLDLGYGV